MEESPPVTEEPKSLREAIESFIKLERLGLKLEKIDKEIQKKTEEDQLELAENLKKKRQELLEKARREPWLESAAGRVNQIDIVSHGVKFTHSAAKGTSVFASHASPEADEWLGTHSVVRDRKNDVVGNAAALDVNKFLCVEYQGKTVLQHIFEESEELLQAMTDDTEKARKWLKAFARVTGVHKAPASSTMSKQLFFPVGSDSYNIIAPLFASSLQHSMYERLHDYFFGDKAKEARKARKENKAHDEGFADFPDLAVQIFGGTKPQNISQLNSERHGEAWLLPSCPPTWKSPKLRTPLNVKTVFGRIFGGRPRVRELTRALAEFLKKTDYNNVHIRRTRALMVDGIVDELILFSAETQSQDSGWSTKSECILDVAEKLWLDPGRTLDDEDFASARRKGDWQELVAERFGNWLNAQLRYHSKKHGELKMGEVEQAAWKAEVENAIKELRTELGYE